MHVCIFKYIVPKRSKRMIINIKMVKVLHLPIKYIFTVPFPHHFMDEDYFKHHTLAMKWMPKTIGKTHWTERNLIGGNLPSLLDTGQVAWFHVIRGYVVNHLPLIYWGISLDIMSQPRLTRDKCATQYLTSAYFSYGASKIGIFHEVWITVTF